MLLRWPGITRQAQRVGSTAGKTAVELGRIESNIQIPSVPEKTGRGEPGRGVSREPWSWGRDR